MLVELPGWCHRELVREDARPHAIVDGGSLRRPNSPVATSTAAGTSTSSRRRCHAIAPLTAHASTAGLNESLTCGIHQLMRSSCLSDHCQTLARAARELDFASGEARSAR
jgi:hypothetical protein